VIEIRQTRVFKNWLDNLADKGATKRIADRILRLQGGLFGDVRPVGEGVSELRISRRTRLPGLLRAARQDRRHPSLRGDKSTQAKDIRAAKSLAADLEE
jgi:putative component of toxin-antitoxin plasmid stabilization module